MKRILIALALIFTSSILFAQKGTITGVLVDSANTKTTLNYATISIFKGTDTVLTTYKLSDDKGTFRIPNLELNVKYRLVINAWLYNIGRKEIIISAANPNLNLGQIQLSEKRNTLNEVVINSERPPVIVRKDTIEFNAESFKTLPTAVVEDMLKKLPGVAVAADGSIQVNGKTVSKILVDGKEFFGGDQQIATKNLPANIIDKIQVSDDQEAKRRDPDLEAVNTPQVINLKLKRAIKKGAFGKFYAGGGLNELFEAGGIMNFFRDTTQVSVLAYGNNVNKPGFSIGDISRIGGFSRTGINSVMINSDGGFALNNISFGGSAVGVQDSYGAGANFNTLTKNGIKINGKYFFGQSNTLIDQLADQEQTLGTNKLFTNTNSNQKNRGFNHILGAKADWKIDSLTNLTIEPTITIRDSRNKMLLQTQNLNTTNQLLSTGNTATRVVGDNTEYLIVANLWKDFKKAGRSLNTSVNISQKDNFNDNYTLSQNNFYAPLSSSSLDQLRNNDIRSFNIYFSANYNDKISKKLSYTIATSGNYIDNENALSTYYGNPLNQAYDIFVPNFSQTVNQLGTKTNSRASINWKATKDLSIQPGFTFNTIDLKNSFSSNPSFEQHYQFFAPAMIIRYKVYSVSLSSSFREPDVNYIQPVANNTNPLYVQNGNANLLPAKTYSINLNLYKYDTKNSLNYNAYLSGSIQKDAIVLSRFIDDNGVQTTTPFNADGIWQYNGGFNITKDIKNAKRQITLGTGFWANVNRNLLEVEGVRSFANIFSISPRFNARINLNDKFELGETYSLSINKSTYVDPFFVNRDFLTHYSDTEMIIRYPKKIVWETNYRIQYNTQTVAGFNNSIQLWNAGVTFLFLKNDRMQLKLSVNDMLNTNTRRYLNISENSIRDTRTNNLGRHGLLTLTYNIQNFGGKVGGKDTFFRF
jgi:hypothetical protein